MPSHLPDLWVLPGGHQYEQTMRTFHHNLHVIDQTIYYIERLGSSHPGLLDGESIETMKN